MKKYVAVLAALLLVSGCASGGNESVQSETMDSVSAKVTKNVTTQSQIKEIYGEPLNVSLSDGGNEIWTYEYSHVTLKPITLVPVVGWFAGGNDIDKNQVVFIFNKKGVVQNFTVHQSQTDVHQGGSDVGEK